MAGQIFHEWNGTVLTITSDSGTSSADLKGVGEMGPRGPQGPAGVSVGEGGNVDLSNYYTKNETYSKTEVDEKIAAVPGGETVDLSNYYTKKETYSKTEVDQKIAEAQLSGGEVDLSGYALKTEIPDVSQFITMSAVEAKGYQTETQVQALINSALAALDGSEVKY